MSKSDKNTSDNNPDEVLKRMLRTPPPTSKKEKAKPKPKKPAI